MDEFHGLSAACVAELKKHTGHYVIEDAPMDNQADDDNGGAECILWCEDCSTTVWYLESDTKP